MMQEKISRYIADTFGETLTENVTFDGKPIRIGKNKHVWVYAHEWTYKGKQYSVAKVGSWKSTDPHKEIKSWEGQDTDKNFKKNYSDQIKKIENSIKVSTHKKNEECRERANKLWSESKNYTSHEYLDKKGIEPFVSRCNNGAIIVPLYDINGMTGTQKIFTVDGKTTKKFDFGIKIKGSICPLKPFKSSRLVYLSEGFSTAATIQMAFPDVPSIAAMNAGNLENAIHTIRHFNPDCRIIIAADDDSHTKEKAGNKYSEKCQRMFKDVIRILPKFDIKSSEYTDFNDLHLSNGIESVVDQLKYNADDFNVITPLGYNEESYFYSSSENQQIVSLKIQNHTRAHLRRLSASVKYWYKNYGVLDDEGEMKLDFNHIADDLIFKCHEKGIFDPSRVRGTGIWQDGSRYVINDGQTVHNENQGSLYLYQKTVRIPFNLVADRVNYQVHLLNTLKKIKTKNPNDYFYISAWFVQSVIFSVMPWRFHLWITGERGSGKSTVLRWINDLCINALLCKNTTAAGIKQECKNNSTPIIYDESEPEDGRTNSILALMREMSDNDDSKSLRGTPTGNSIKHSTEVNFLFGSIQMPNLNSADKSRIFVVELDNTKEQSEKEYLDMVEAIEEVKMNKDHIFTHIYENISNIIDAFKLARRCLSGYNIEARQKDQLSSAIACFSSYFMGTTKIDESFISKVIKEFNLAESEYTKENEEKESDLAYQCLMNTIIDSRESRTVSNLINRIKSPEYGIPKESISLLGSHGIIYCPDSDELFISKNNQNLIKKIPQYPDMGTIFKRDSSYFLRCEKKKPTGSVQNRGTVIKIKYEDLHD